jgi:hypothetical protein
MKIEILTCYEPIKGSESIPFGTPMGLKDELTENATMTGETDDLVLTFCQFVKFQNALRVPAIQLVHQQNVARKIKNEKNVIIIASAADWLAGLN